MVVRGALRGVSEFDVIVMLQQKQPQQRDVYKMHDSQKRLPLALACTHRYKPPTCLHIYIHTLIMYLLVNAYQMKIGTPKPEELWR